MSDAAGNGLATVNKYYEDYGSRARELKGQGKSIIGYLCALSPVEMIQGAGFIPFRIKGNVSEPITKADSQLETIVCPLVRSCFDLSLKERYEFLEGIVIPHACDSITRSYSTIRHSLGLPYSHFVNLPHTIKDISLEFFKEELNTFRKSLSRYSGRELANSDLAQAVQAYNKQRAKVRELYELRKPNPPLISGGEITRTLVAAMSLPVEESIDLLDSVIAEVRQRSESPAKKGARIMVIGGQVDDATFIDLIEENDASVVADDLCPGAREHWFDVNATEDPIDGIAERYLRRVYCGRTYRGDSGNYQQDLEERFGHIGRFIKDFKVDGVILYIYRYCDPFGFEVPAMESYIDSFGVPTLHLEDEYSMSSIGRLRTRVQAFLEMIS
ncbi:MAG: 2-hydroxyacyl-CoA dehydratase subunit D [Chloroflexota bacterium]